MIPSDDLIGLVPAAGRGLRLGLPYPKELYPIIQNNRYKPVAQYVVENLTAAGIKHIVFVINETKHQLISYFGDGRRFGCHFSYVVQEQRELTSQSTSPGLAQALDSAYHLIRDKVVCFGMADTIMTPAAVFRSLLTAGQPEDELILGLYPTDKPQKFGMVMFGADGHVGEIVDKPVQTDLTHMWGLMVWGPKFTEYLHGSLAENRVADFAQTVNFAVKAGLRVRAVRIEGGTFSDLGTYEEIMELDRRQHQ